MPEERSGEENEDEEKVLAWNGLTPQNSNNFFYQPISMNYLYQSQVSKPLSINKKNSFK